MTADPRQVIRDAVYEQWHRIQDYDSDPEIVADAVLAALTVEGLAVVPVAERREEWGIRFIVDGRSCVDRYNDRKEAADGLSYMDSGEVVHRAVQTGSWKAPDA